jgi:hypothetical protein
MNPKIISYKTIRSNSHSSLDSAINELIAEGWQPYGSPYTSASQGGGTNYVYQALIRYESTDSENNGKTN